MKKATARISESFCRLLKELSAWINGGPLTRFNAIRFPVDKHE